MAANAFLGHTPYHTKIFNAKASSSDSASCFPPITRAALRILAEGAILVPALLLMLPLTHHKWKEAHLARIDGTPARKGNKLCILLRVIAWVIWGISALSLIIGISIGSHFFGIISISGLLAFFAQGVSSVGCLLSSRMLEDDDVQRATWPVGEKESALVSAARWTNPENKNPLVVSISPTEKHGNEAALPYKKHATNDPSHRQEYHFRYVNHARNIEFLLFFFMKIMLLQTPYFLHCGLVDPLHQGNLFIHDRSPIIPKEIPGAVAFVCTICVPLFTHGVGGTLFNGNLWSFHHPFDGGKSHVTAQATGWSLVALAGILHLAFIHRGMDKQYGKDFLPHLVILWHRENEYNQRNSFLSVGKYTQLSISLALITNKLPAYLFHSGSFLSWFAESVLLYSIIEFRPKETNDWNIKGEPGHYKSTLCHFISFIQNFVATNFHWLFCWWLFFTLMGFNTFSLTPMKGFLCASLSQVALNTSFLLFAWSIPYAFISYEPRRKQWKWNIFGICTS